MDFSLGVFYIALALNLSIAFAAVFDTCVPFDRSIEPLHNASKPLTIQIS